MSGNYLMPQPRSFRHADARPWVAQWVVTVNREPAALAVGSGSAIDLAHRTKAMHRISVVELHYADSYAEVDPREGGVTVYARGICDATHMATIHAAPPGVLARG